MDSYKQFAVIPGKNIVGKLIWMESWQMAILPECCNKETYNR